MCKIASIAMHVHVSTVKFCKCLWSMLYVVEIFKCMCNFLHVSVRN